EAAAAVTTVSQNMRDIPTDQLQAATEKAFILADTFDADIADSTKTANTLMKNFGIESGQAFDLMTVAFQKGGNFSDELLDTLNEYA
ncbi:phage tail tape measure protein, partial [Pantoea sp. SIMBA_133]